MNKRVLKNSLLLSALAAGFVLIFLFALPQTARATEMDEVFTIADGKTNDVQLSVDGPPSIGTGAAILHVRINMTGSAGTAGKDTNADGIVDDYDVGRKKLTGNQEENLGGWDAMYDEEITDVYSGTADSQGIFLLIKEKGETGFVGNYGLAERLKLARDNTDNFSLNNPQLLVWNKNIDFNFRVGGLEADKTYEAQIQLKEDFSSDQAEGSVFEFKTPATGPAEPTVTDQTFVAGGQTVFNTELDLKCELANFSLKKCFAGFIYNAVFWPVQLLTKVAAYFLDFMVGYAIDDGSYRHPFVERGWAIVRDVANIGFIFALIYIAFRTMLGVASAQGKKMIATLIIAALLINFSLFFTRVLIDVGNGLAHIFYNNIEVKNPNTGEDSPPLVPERKNVALALVSKVGIGTILSTGGLGADAAFGWYLLAIFLVITLEVLMIYVFFSVGLLFVGRVIGLWLSMIFAPVAFVSYAIPAEIPYFGHKDWWNDLLKQTFMAPLFIFFLYLIVMYLESPLAPGGGGSSASAATALAAGTGGGQDFTQRFMGVVIPFAMMVVLIFAAKKIAVEFSGRITKVINDTIGGIAKTAGGVALGVATGGAALALRGTVGKFAAGRITPELQARAAAGDKGAKRKLDFYSGLSKSSFDARSTMLGKAIQEKTGMKFGGGIVDLLGTGEKSTEGGVRGAQERKKEKDFKEFKEKYALTDAEAEEQDDKAGEWKGKYQEEAEKFKEKAKKGGAEFDEKEFRKQYESGKSFVVRDSKGQIMANNYFGTERVKTSDEENTRRRKQYAEMKYGLPYQTKQDEAVRIAEAQAAAQGKSFDEAAFRKEYEKKYPPPAELYKKDKEEAVKRAEERATARGETFDKADFEKKYEKKYPPPDKLGLYRNETRDWWKRILYKGGAGAIYGAGGGPLGALGGGVIGLTIGGLSELKNIIKGGFKVAVSLETPLGGTFVGKGLRGTREFFGVEEARANLLAALRRGKTREREFLDNLTRYMSSGQPPTPPPPRHPPTPPPPSTPPSPGPAPGGGHP